MTAQGGRAEQIALAHRVVRALDRRNRLDEAVGVLHRWTGRDTAEVRRNLVGRNGPAGQDAEAAGVTAIVDAQADARADPDWDQ
jgi:hypothetical protein